MSILKYNIEIYPNLTGINNFIGVVKMKLKGKLNSIKLNILNLQVLECNMDYTINDNIIDIINITSNILIIKYIGQINDNMLGFYKSKYSIYSTQCEPEYARMIFPCTDVPSEKSIFQLTLYNIPPNMIALSNTSIKHKTDNMIIFNDTPLMSTYLFAFCFGELEYIEQMYNNIPIRIYAPISHNNLFEQCSYALEVCVKSLQYFESMFNIKYPLSKLDLVAIPEFRSGAMENWGLITFRMTSLLCDNTASFNQKINIVITVCHELAHQWFGNLVTMDNWSNLWLNESFANWISYYVIDKIYPNLDIWTNFYYSTFGHTIHTDALETSHPIYSLENPDEIFDCISYNKGAYMIMMIISYVGINKFIHGLNVYFKKYKYGNASTNDLLECIDIKLIKIMYSWLYNKGFPLIGDFGKQCEFGTKTVVQNCIWSTVFVPNKSKLNIGFYLYEYNTLINYINNNNCPNNRLYIIENLYMLSKFRYIKITILLTHFETCTTETNYYVVQRIYDILYELYLLFGQGQKQSLIKYFKLFIPTITKNIKNHVLFKQLLLNIYYVIGHKLPTFDLNTLTDPNIRNIIYKTSSNQIVLNKYKYGSNHEKVSAVQTFSYFSVDTFIKLLDDIFINDFILKQDIHIFTKHIYHNRQIYVNYILQNIEIIYNKYESSIFTDIIVGACNCTVDWDVLKSFICKLNDKINMEIKQGLEIAYNNIKFIEFNN